MKIIKEIINNIAFKNNFFVIGIDGPTASGKTTLADNLAKQLNEKNIPVFIYRLDWCLIERTKRLEDLNKLLEIGKAFEYEADLHMDLNKASDFLSKVNSLRHKELEQTTIINLTKLYNRSDNGRCTGKEVVELKPKMVIIVEGHYTHHPKIRTFIDYNILLVAGTKHLLHRKAQRVKSYRNNDTVEKYFALVDLPSFNHYFTINIPFFDKILLNETFYTQKTLSIKDVVEMYNIKSTTPDTSVEELILPATSQDYQLKTKELKKLLSLIKYAHEYFIKLWGIHPSSRKESHSDILNRYLNEINKKAEYSVFSITDANTFQYEYGIIEGEIYFLINGNLNDINLTVFASYTHRRFKVDFNKEPDELKKHFELFDTFKTKNNKFNIICPNKILVPDFLKTYSNTEYSFYKKESARQNSLDLFYYNKVFFVGRMQSLQQHEFYNAAYSKIGFYVVNCGNYTFISNFCSTETIDDFTKLKNSFGAIGIKHNIEISDEIKNNLSDAGCIINEDDIFITPHVNKNLLIKTYLKSDIRVKNLLTKSLCRQYGDVEIFDNIELKEYIDALPVSLNELYFGLSISKLGMLSYYSIFSNYVPGIDIQTYFKHYIKNQTPFGMQASLNALGITDKKGYLGINGPKEFALIIKENLIQFLSENKGYLFPPWSLGIDHINTSDSNFAIANLFVKQSVESGMIKSFCIDTSNLITNDLEKTKNRIKAYFQELFNILKSTGYDIELYVGHESVFANLDLEDSISIYKAVSSIFKNFIEEYKFEPYVLFGPFLGTKHHKANGEINADYSEEIFNKLIKYNLIGNVLHGTSYVPFSEIKSLKNKHCVRVNYAGKFLDAIIKNLQIEHQIIGKTQYEWKQHLSSLNTNNINSKQEEIKKDFDNILNEISELEPKKMSSHEIAWFRNNNIAIPQDDFVSIINKITTAKSNNH
ncbi:MAG: hypothetical protein RBR24_09995, partial [Candidatus Carbobacillus sp.]|nr:hypothetical protein [Candidatus Carbobacillus sp.]